MKTGKRLLITFLAALITSLLVALSLHFASTSYGLSVDGRRNALICGFISLVIGSALVIGVWLPFRKKRD